jgi:hypothetical protein
LGQKDLARQGIQVGGKINSNWKLKEFDIMFTRLTVDTLINKLDTNVMSISEAKQWLKVTYRIEIKERSKEKFIKALWDEHRKRTC